MISASEPPPGLYRVRIDRTDVGRRVVVRRVLDDGRTGLGDVLGELVAWDDGLLTVRTRDGVEVQVREADVVSAKPVPPPARRAGGR